MKKDRKAVVAHVGRMKNGLLSYVKTPKTLAELPVALNQIGILLFACILKVKYIKLKPSPSSLIIFRQFF